MSKNTILLIAAVAVVSIGYYYWQSDQGNIGGTNIEINSISNQRQEQGAIKSYVNLSSEELAGMLVVKDFKLIDVHIPEQRHISGTDAFIPFNEVEKIVAMLSNKNEKVVLYCRSGGMSRQVSKELIKRGYTDVFHLANGLNGWIAEGRETLPMGQLQ